jgi:hypothetical protein
LKIKKQVKKESTKRKRIVLVSAVLIIAVPYIISILNDQQVFKGWEVFFAFAYAVVVDLLLIINIIRIISENNFDFTIHNQKIKIKDGLLRAPLTIFTDKIVYVDAVAKNRDDFNILIVIKRNKRNKNLLSFDNDFVKQHSQYRDTFNSVMQMEDCSNLCYYIIRKAGSKKYYYLYLLYKNSYGSEFSDTALEYIRRFSEEYNL